MILNAFHMKFHAWKNGIPPGASRPPEKKSKNPKNYVQDIGPEKVSKNNVQDMDKVKNKTLYSRYEPKNHKSRHTSTNANGSTGLCGDDGGGGGGCGGGDRGGGRGGGDGGGAGGW